MLKMEEMLYPQYEDTFTTISTETWEWLQKEANAKLAEGGDVHPSVKAHWESIVGGIVPFGYRITA